MKKEEEKKTTELIELDALGDGASDEDGDAVTELPWGDVVKEPIDPVYEAIRQRHIERRGLQDALTDDADEVDELPPIEDADEVDELPPTEDADEVDELPPIEEADEVDELPPIEDADEVDELPPIEEADEVDELPPIEDADEVDELPPIEEADEVDELPPIEDADEIDELPPIEEVDEVDELPPIEEADEVDELPPIEEVDEVDELPPIKEADEVDELPPIEEADEVDELLPIEEADEVDELPPIEDADEVDELPPIEGADEVDELLPIEDADIKEIPREVDEDGVPTYDLAEGYDVTVRAFAWTPKPRGKGSTTPIDDEIAEGGIGANTVLPSRRKDKEFTAYAQGMHIREGYKSRLKQEFTRFQWGFLIVLVAFICENLDLVGVTILMPSENLILSTAISAALIVLASIPILCELWDGLVMLLRAKPVSESLLIPLMLIPLGYYAVLLVSDTAPVMQFGFAFAVAALIAKLQSLFRYLREAKTFRVVSSEKPKRVLSSLSKTQGKEEREAFAPYVTPDAEFYAVKRTLFADGYFAMTNAVSRNQLANALYLVLSVGAAALVFGVSLASHIWQEALSYALISFYFTLPFATLFIYELPLLLASFAAAEHQAAIIGAAAFERVGDEGVVSFADSDIFSANDITLCNILLFREEKVERLLEYTALVFDEINSSVATVIKRSVPQYRMDDPITVLSSVEGGIEVMIDSKRVLLGSHSFMNENKVAMPLGFVYEDSNLTQLFVSVDGDLWGKLDFEYSLDRDSREALEYLENAGYYIAIRSLDPNLTHDMLAKLLKFDISPIRLVKSKEAHELLRMRKHTASPFVSVSRTKSLIGALVLSGKSAYTTKVGMILAGFSLVVGVALVLLSVLLDSVILLSGVGVVLYQIFWILPILLLTLAYVKNKQSRK